MHQTNDHLTQRLRFFYEMIQCIEGLSCRTYSCGEMSSGEISPETISSHGQSFTLLYSNCPDEMLFHSFFESCGFFDKILTYAESHDAPYAVGTYIGMVWYAVLEKKDRALQKLHLLGPVFFAPVEKYQMELFLREDESIGMSFHAKYLLLDAMQRLPVIFQKQFGQLALMLHDCVNGERLSLDDLHALIDRQLNETVATAPGLYRDIYRQNKELFACLSRGFQPQIQEHKVISTLPTHAAHIRTPLRQLKDSAVIFISQCANAAVEGGVTAECAYALADRYYGSIEQNRSPLELTALFHSAYGEFLALVQEQQRRCLSYSADICTCIEYICSHPEEDLSLSRLAALIGYSTYYLSRKFKAETGSSLPAYIKQQRIEYSTVLLSSTDEDLEAIADRLHFCSRSHFSDTFHKIMGMTPSQYREQHRIS